MEGLRHEIVAAVRDEVLRHRARGREPRQSLVHLGDGGHALGGGEKVQGGDQARVQPLARMYGYLLQSR